MCLHDSYTTRRVIFYPDKLTQYKLMILRNRQFGLNNDEKEALSWAWPYEIGNTMFHVVNAIMCINEL